MDGATPVGVSDHCIMSFEHNHRTAACRSVPRRIHFRIGRTLIRRCLQSFCNVGEKARKLSAMWCKNRVLVQSLHARRVLGNERQAIGVKDHPARKAKMSLIQYSIQ